MAAIDVDVNPDRGYSAPFPDGRQGVYYPELSVIELPLPRAALEHDASRGADYELSPFEEWVLTHELLHSLHEPTAAMHALFLMNAKSLWAYRECLDATSASSSDLGQAVAYFLLHETVLAKWRNYSRLCMELHAHINYPPEDDLQSRIDYLRQLSRPLKPSESKELLLEERLLDVQEKLGERLTQQVVSHIIQDALSPRIFGTQQILTPQRRSKLGLSTEPASPQEPLLYPDARFVLAFMRFAAMTDNIFAEGALAIEPHQSNRLGKLTPAGLSKALFTHCGLPVSDLADPAVVAEFGQGSPWPQIDSIPPEDDLSHPRRAFVAAAAALSQPQPLATIFHDQDHPVLTVINSNLRPEEEESFKALYLQTRFKNLAVAELLSEYPDPGKFDQERVNLCPPSWHSPEVDVLRHQSQQLVATCADSDVREINMHYHKLRSKLPTDEPVLLTTLSNLLPDGRFLVPVPRPPEE